MKTYKTITKTVTMEDEMFCDMCGKTIVEYKPYSYELSELSYDRGVSYPDDGWSVEKWEVDLCGDCMQIIKGFLESKGVKIIYKDDYH